MIKKETITLGSRDVVVKEISIAAQLRLEEIDNFVMEDVHKESVSADDWKYMKSTEGQNEISRVEWFSFLKLVNDLNARPEIDNGIRTGTDNTPTDVGGGDKPASDK